MEVELILPLMDHEWDKDFWNYEWDKDFWN